MRALLGMVRVVTRTVLPASEFVFTHVTEAVGLAVRGRG
jgi:hypothetical protein